ncbi:ABC transporter permease [Cytobacillus sp. FSL R7-0696]|uniref:ABC transporter permease n=1 Tax=Cytobacillus sp. FSL R7-0696 TaxID=2921691 RepID=UPI0030F7EB25
MTLFDLAIKNIRRNVKSYGLYIGSMIFSIIIYFTFVTLKYSEDITALAAVSKQVSSIMSASAFVLIIFVAVFILYSNSFFMKKRKQEVALYSLLGVRKRSIGFMLFFENIVIGVIALIIGVGLGFLLSQLLLMVLLKLMGLEVMSSLAFSPSAVVNTVIVFMILFLFTSLQGYRVIYRFKLIDLFHAEKKGEELPKARLISAVLGVASLAGAYWLALQDLMTSEVWRLLSVAMPLVIIGLTVLGTYLIFNSVLVYILSKLKNQKNWAWKGLNLWTTSQLLHRIRGNARTLTVIATLSATTITAGGAVFGLYYNADKEIETYTPITFMWEGEPQKITQDIVVYEEEIKSKTVRIAEGDMEIDYQVMDYSTFKQLATQQGWEGLPTINQEEAFILDTYYDERWSTKVDEVKLNKQTLNVIAYEDRSVVNTFTMGGKLLVVTDAFFEQIDSPQVTYQAVQVEDYKKQQALSDDLASSTEQFSSATQQYKDSIEASGSMLFVGSFLGLVFLVATGSIIFFKMMTEAEEDKGKYQVLYKIGVSQKEMKRTIRHQVGMIFTAPLLLGLMHGAIALVAFSNLLMMNLLIPVVIWMLAYTIIYFIYYFLTIRSFQKTIFSMLGER